MTPEVRPWPTDPRYLVSSDGVMFGLSGQPIGVLDKRTGYVIVSYRTRERRTSMGLHAIVCETFHGPKPGPEYQAAHENGIRSENGAANLRWDTPEGNARDRIRHGTACSRLTEDAVREIRASVESQRVLALRFGVSQPTICHIRSGRTWREVA